MEDGRLARLPGAAQQDHRRGTGPSSPTSDPHPAKPAERFRRFPHQPARSQYQTWKARKLELPLCQRTYHRSQNPNLRESEWPFELETHPRALGLMSLGNTVAAHTMDSSSAVRVTEVKGPLHAHSGTSPSADKRQTANFPGIRENLKPRLVMSPNVIGWPSRYDSGRHRIKQVQEGQLLFGGKKRSFERVSRQLTQVLIGKAE